MEVYELQEELKKEEIRVKYLIKELNESSSKIDILKAKILESREYSIYKKILANFGFLADYPNIAKRFDNDKRN